MKTVPTDGRKIWVRSTRGFKLEAKIREIKGNP